MSRATPPRFHPYNAHNTLKLSSGSKTANTPVYQSAIDKGKAALADQKTEATEAYSRKKAHYQRERFQAFQQRMKCDDDARARAGTSRVGIEDANREFMYNMEINVKALLENKFTAEIREKVYGNQETIESAYELVIKDELRARLIEDLEPVLKADLRAQLQEEIRDELMRELAPIVKRELQDSLRSDHPRHTISNAQDEDTLRSEFALKIGSNVREDDGLRSNYIQHITSNAQGEDTLRSDNTKNITSIARDDSLRSDSTQHKTSNAQDKDTLRSKYTKNVNSNVREKDSLRSNYTRYTTRYTQNEDSDSDADVFEDAPEMQEDQNSINIGASEQSPTKLVNTKVDQFNTSEVALEVQEDHNVIISNAALEAQEDNNLINSNDSGQLPTESVNAEAEELPRKSGKIEHEHPATDSVNAEAEELPIESVNVEHEHPVTESVEVVHEHLESESVITEAEPLPCELDTAEADRSNVLEDAANVQKNNDLISTNEFEQTLPESVKTEASKVRDGSKSPFYQMYGISSRTIPGLLQAEAEGPSVYRGNIAIYTKKGLHFLDENDEEIPSSDDETKSQDPEVTEVYQSLRRSTKRSSIGTPASPPYSPSSDDETKSQDPEDTKVYRSFLQSSKRSLSEANDGEEIESLNQKRFCSDDPFSKDESVSGQDDPFSEYESVSGQPNEELEDLAEYRRLRGPKRYFREVDQGGEPELPSQKRVRSAYRAYQERKSIAGYHEDDGELSEGSDFLAGAFSGEPFKFPPGVGFQVGKTVNREEEGDDGDASDDNPASQARESVTDRFGRDSDEESHPSGRDSSDESSETSWQDGQGGYAPQGLITESNTQETPFIIDDSEDEEEDGEEDEEKTLVEVSGNREIKIEENYDDSDEDEASLFLI